MPNISRRLFMAGAMAAAPGLVGLNAFGQAPASDSLYIIDASVDTSPFVDMLERAGVQVVARYLSRGCQIGNDNSLTRKRIAFNPPLSPAEACGNNVFQGDNSRKKPEHESLLEKFALLSVYQYQSSNPRKFAVGLPESHDLVEAAVRSGTPRDLAGGTVEAQLDAEAALLQSKRIKQPDQAPIYFGVDFNMLPQGTVTDQNNQNQTDAKKAMDGCLQYFRVLKGLIGDRLGVYGNGYVNRILRSEGLVRFSWVSESRSFEETPNILRDGFKMKDGTKEEWHLFQHLIDSNWIDPHPKNADASKLELDGNVHNPRYDYFGAWRNGDLWRPDLQRSTAILNNRRVAKRNAPVFDVTDSTAKCIVKSGKPLIAAYHRSVRVLGDPIHDNGKTWLHVDLDENGSPDGFCLESDFIGGIKQMPNFDGAEWAKKPNECLASQ